MIRFLLLYSCLIFFFLGLGILFKQEVLVIIEYKTIRPILYNAINWMLDERLKIPREDRRIFPGFETFEYVCITEKTKKLLYPGDEADLTTAGDVRCPREIKLSGTGSLRLLRKIKGDFVFQHSNGKLEIEFKQTDLYLSSSLGFLKLKGRGSLNSVMLTPTSTNVDFFCRRGTIDLENLTARVINPGSLDSILGNHACLVTYRERKFSSFWKELSPTKVSMAGDIFEIASIETGPRSVRISKEIKVAWREFVEREYNRVYTHNEILLSIQAGKGADGKQALISWETTVLNDKKCQVHDVKNIENGEQLKTFLTFDSKELKGQLLINYAAHKGNYIFLSCDSNTAFYQSALTLL